MWAGGDADRHRARNTTWSQGMLVSIQDQWPVVLALMKV
jgi:hypothetical protein